jgi:hypothetical protein
MKEISGWFPANHLVDFGLVDFGLVELFTWQPYA